MKPDREDYTRGMMMTSDSGGGVPRAPAAADGRQRRAYGRGLFGSPQERSAADTDAAPGSRATKRAARSAASAH